MAASRPKLHTAKRVAIRSWQEFDVIVTDPPYYDAIPYSDLMDFFYVWLRSAVTACLPKSIRLFGIRWPEMGP